MAKERRLGRGYEHYNGYVIRATVYQKDVDALCDKKVYVQIYDPAPWYLRWMTKTLGKPYRRFSGVASTDSMTETIDELKDRAKQVIDHRLEEPDV